MIDYSDMDQSLKGENINFIGQLDALGVEKKEDLKRLDYYNRDEKNEETKVNRFF